MKIYYLSVSKKKGKKFDIKIPDGSIISFGAIGYEDFTIHKDPKRKKLYILRHKSRENWSKPTSPGFFSRWLLWNKPDLNQSIKSTEKKFNIRIMFN